MKLWVIDTNVVVSSMRVPTSPPALLLDAVANRRVRMAYDDRILSEYREVLNRQRLQISPRIIANFLAHMRHQQRIYPTYRLRSGPDPDDLMFIEVALATPQKTIVTGNVRDFPRATRNGVRILTPAQALSEI